MPEIDALLSPELETFAPWLVYLVTWSFVFIESGLLVGFLLPGDSLIFAAGLIAGTPGSNVNIVVLCTGLFIAAFTGDQIGYVLGRTLGRPWVERRNRPSWTVGLARAEQFYERLGPVSVVVARFIPWARTFVPFAAGVAAMHYTRFLVANVAGALVWAIGLTLVGYYAAANPVVRTVAFVIAGFFIVISFVYMGVAGVRAWLRRRRSDSEGSLTM